jgi:hypothetical protein
MEGFQRGRNMDKIGQKAADTAELFFTDVRVPAENLLGEENRGFYHLMRNLPAERLGIAIHAVAQSRRALELTRQYASERRAFGTPIGSFQVNRHAIADMSVKLDVMQVYVDRCIEAVNAGQLTAQEAAGAKLWATETQWEIVDRCFAAVSFPRDQAHNRAVLFEDILPGCYDRTARLADMDRNHTDASLCFPTFPRFCGQTFLERGERDLALACVRAYNDWMTGEWCADEARGRLIPLTLVPLWDPDLAAQEVRRCAAKGSHALAFSENPAALGLPSVHTDAWDPLWAACEETDTVVNMHIGSSSTFSKTSDDAPPLVIIALTFEGASHALVDWLTSGILTRFPNLRIALSEGQVG